MPLSTPDNIEESPEAESETSEGVPKATVVGEEMPVDEAIEFLSDQMYSELDHVFERINEFDDRTGAVESDVERLTEQVQELKEAVEGIVGALDEDGGVEWDHFPDKDPFEDS